jgi:hypothetical protein
MLYRGRLWVQFRRQLSFRSDKICEFVGQWRPDGVLRSLLRLWWLYVVCNLTRCLRPRFCKFGSGLLCGSFHSGGLFSGSFLGGGLLSGSFLSGNPLGGS